MSGMTTFLKSEPLRHLRRYAYGAVQILGEAVCALPSQHLRRWLLKLLFRLKMRAGAILFRSTRLREPWKIYIGANSVIGGAVELDGRGGLEIGNNVNISSEAMIWTMQHDYDDPFFAAVAKRVTIEDYVWIGPRVVVLPGVIIARGCVIAASAVVAKSTEPFGVYAGIPAKRIGERSKDVRYTLGGDYTPFV